MKRTLVLFVVFAFPSLAWAENLYVAQNIQGSGNGDSCNNARNFTFFNTAGNWGAAPIANRIDPGDTVVLCGTIVTALNVRGSGTAANPITITADPTVGATLDLQSIGSNVGINFLGKQYVYVDGVTGDARAGNFVYPFRCINLAPGSTNNTDSWCFYTVNAPGGHIKVKHVEITGSGGSTDVSNQEGGNQLLTLAVGDLEFAYNWMHGVSVGTKLNTTALVSNAGVVGATDYTSGCLFHDNLIQYLQHDGFRPGYNCSIYNNEITGVDGSTHSDSIVAESLNYVAIYNNYIHDSGDQNIFLRNGLNSTTGHIRIYNNVFKSDPGFGIAIDPQGGVSSVIDDLVIVNNTFYTTSAASIKMANQGAVTNLVLLNNIFGTQTNSVPGNYWQLWLDAPTTFASASSFDYNVYSTSSAHYPDLVQWPYPTVKNLAQLQAVGRETNARVGIPIYVNAGSNNFHLTTSDTVAKGFGVNLTSTYSWLTTDKDGNARPASGAWDIGAYQAVGDILAPAAPTGITVQ